ncbi:6243_t:CDS:2, partial [Acaulospora morrowiae]
MATLTPLPTSSQEYTQLHNEFIYGMNSHSYQTNQNIISILKIQMPNHIVKKHEDYKGQYSVQKVYHGTKQRCNVKTTVITNKLCSDQYCGVCGILRIGPRIPSMRDNGMIWFGCVSYISHDYTVLHGDCRAMFVMDVVRATTQDGSVVTINSAEVFAETPKQRWNISGNNKAMLYLDEDLRLIST